LPDFALSLEFCGFAGDARVFVRHIFATIHFRVRPAATSPTPGFLGFFDFAATGRRRFSII
jgi:hypothetical protein